MSNYNLPSSIDLSDIEVAATVETALDWIERNTSITIDREAELPPNVKLFVIKYCDFMSQSIGVASESLGGMSQSFKTEGAGSVLSDLAAQLFGSDYKGRNRFVSAVSRWK